MLTKIKTILGSIRFWILTLAGIVSLLEAKESGMLDITTILETTKLWLAGVVGIGTLDSIASKFGGNKS